jgi:NodT family efflux transporter outer membrane factor (OMF) lipoprotein
MDGCPAENKIAPHRAPGSRHDARTLAARLLLIGFAILAAGGCTSLRDWWRNGFKVGPNYAEPPAPIAANWIDSGTDPHIQNSPPNDCAWWTVFRDRVLDDLIDNAYRQNLDLRAAGTRILEARAQRNVAIGNLFPQSQQAIAAYGHGQVSTNMAFPIAPIFDIWATGFNASWELDFWGRYRRTIEANNADLAASNEAYGDTLVMLLAEVARTYVQLRTFEERLAFARRNVEIQRGSTGLANDRFTQGVASELDLRQARSNLAQTESLIPPLEAGRRQANNRLCILMGMPPQELAARLGPGPIPVAPPQVAVGVPADLLRRRPDIRRAERQVAAQSARIGVATADLYPRLTLNGFLGYVANDASQLFDPKSFTGIIFPTLQWNVLNYGRIANNIRAQDARLEGVALQYQQSVLNAGREVEDALTAFVQAQQQAARLDESVREAARSVDLVLIQFQGGVTDFNRVYNTQSTLVSQQDQLASTRGNIALYLIDVYRSLGGGWYCFVPGCGLPAVHHPPEGPQQLPPPSESVPSGPSLESARRPAAGAGLR